MINVSSSLINNIDEKKLLRFLANHKCVKEDDFSGMATNQWLSKLLTDKQIDLKTLNEYFFNELFYGMHRVIHIYKIKSYRKAKYVNDWINGIGSDYNINKLNFNNIIGTNVTRDDSEKIVAIESDYDEKNELKKLKILFIKQIDIIKESGLTTAYSYIPVEVDFKKKILVIKARHRQKIRSEKHKHKYLMEKIYNKIIDKMQIEILPFNNKNEQTLYNMSKGLVEELFNKIEGFNSIKNMENPIDIFLKDIVEKLPLDNVEKDDKENIQINTSVMNIKDELSKLLQQLILADYFFNRDEDNILDIGISAIITCITFNDSKNATARLNGENRTRHIFNSKSFMGLRNSIEAVKIVETLSIAYKKNRFSMHVKYDATEDDYLSVLVKSYRSYEEADFEKIWEMYMEYESDIIEETTELCKANFS